MKRSIFLSLILGLSLIFSNIAKAITIKEVNIAIFNWACVIAGLALANTPTEDLEKIIKKENKWKWWYTNIWPRSIEEKRELFSAFKNTMIFRTIPGLALAGFGAYRLFLKK